MIMNWVRFILGTGCLLFGLFFFVSSIVGNYRFKFALNRMHSAALGDTLGLLGIISGISLYNGFNAVTLKFIIVVALIWLTSPVSSHLIMLMEISNGRYISESRLPTDEEGFENYSVDIKREALRRHYQQGQGGEENKK